MLKLGVLINPVAGLGGALALKGSDTLAAAHIEAGAEDARAAPSRAGARMLRALQPHLQPCQLNNEVATEADLKSDGKSHEAALSLYTCAGSMGIEQLDVLHHRVQTVYHPATPSGASDTQAAARALQKAGVDLLLFAGGDGTARDIYDAIGETLPVLGIPAGVKMHSGVFALSPEAAAQLLDLLLTHSLVNVALADVRDIDEEAFQRGIVKARHYGEMRVPLEGGFLQQTKIGGVESEDLVQVDIAAYVLEEMQDERFYIVGPGSTTAAIKSEIDTDFSLLGVDLVHRKKMLARDLTETQLLKHLTENPDNTEIIVTAIGGQGHIFGRGNQQLSPAVLEIVGMDNISIVATKTKITALAGRPLIVDSNSTILDEKLRGYRAVITGYRDTIMYPVA